MVVDSKLIAHTIFSEAGKLRLLKKKKESYAILKTKKTKKKWLRKSQKQRETTKNPSKSHFHNTFGNTYIIFKIFSISG